MYDEIKEFKDLKYPHLIDFKKGNVWTWGFSSDGNNGFIYHFPNMMNKENDSDYLHKDSYCIAYKVPAFMTTMITQTRDVAVLKLKNQIKNLDEERAKLLK
jgi:hypothetical protein